MISALLELRFSSKAKSYNCSTCPDSVRRLRRCDEDRDDFTEADGSFWPIRVLENAGELYGFCPGKASKNPTAVGLFHALILSAGTGAQWCFGGISEQPAWWVEIAANFMVTYSDMKFEQRAKAILGDGKNGGNTKHPRIPNKN